MKNTAENLQITESIIIDQRIAKGLSWFAETFWHGQGISVSIAAHWLMKAALLNPEIIEKAFTGVINYSKAEDLGLDELLCARIYAHPKYQSPKPAKRRRRKS